MTNISIIIATYNRSQDLHVTLTALGLLVVSGNVNLEVIVVDNNSSDDTGVICKQTYNGLSIAYLFEPRQGKSNALNKAISCAKGELLVFMDDDVTVDEPFINEYIKAAIDYPDVSYFGGKVLPLENEGPKWFRENYDWLGVTPVLDYGDVSFTVGDENRLFFLGANMAIRSKVFYSGLLYDPSRGPSGAYGEKNGRHGAEEGKLQHDMIEQGYSGLYVPAAKVFHRDPPHRMTKRYLRWYCRGYALEEFNSGCLKSSKRRIMGVPGYFIKEFVVDLLKSLFFCLMGQCTNSLKSEVAYLTRWWQIVEAFKRRAFPWPSDSSVSRTP